MDKNSRILIACEESQAVLSEFKNLGFTNVWSCDLLSTSGNYPELHLQQDVIELLKQKWDMIIAFPPCTDLCTSGARHFERKRADGSQQRSIEFFMLFANADCQKIAIENPIGIMSTEYKKPNQIIQPWQFGDKAQKSTCLWLKGLPNLQPTNIVEKGEFVEFISKKGILKRQPKWYFDCLKLSPKERSIARSKTFKGIARAMAEQWSNA